MTESPKITFDGTVNTHQYVYRNGKNVGDICPTYGEGSTKIVGFSVFDYQLNSTVNNSCTNMNQAKAFAEMHFGKEVQP